MAHIDFHPQVFGNYYLLEHIAYGGMAEIYRAKSFGASGFERELVLKRVLKKLTDNPDFLRMLVNEAKLTATLQHGNIAQVFELGLSEGVYFITMEYVEGVSLKKLLRQLSKSKQKLQPAVAAYIGTQIAQGLHYAHEKADSMGKPFGIVHCDISPENVVIGFDGNVKIVDFGIARAQASFSNYKDGMVMGKFNYVAPEQAMGRTLDRRADIFSTGIILYEMLTGEHPFGRKGDVDTLVRIARFAKGEVEPPYVRCPELQPRLSEITMTAMAHGLEERYASAQIFADSLEEFLAATPKAKLHAAVQSVLVEQFGEELRTRRVARTRDPEVISELQRKVATDASAAASVISVPGGASALAKPSSRTPSPSRLKAAWLWGALGLVAGALAGGGGSALLSKVASPVLFVSSSPPGATVKLEGEPIGETPLAKVLEDGQPYLLRLELKGYEAWEETFSAKGRLLSRTPVLQAQLAILGVRSTPEGAEVTVDGVVKGKTPLALTLPVGKNYRVRVGMGHRFEERRVSLEGAGTRLDFSFPQQAAGPKYRGHR